jgi:hypothetical protein
MVERAFVLALALLAAAPAAQAIPAFARRYQVACSFCHEGYPKLSSMGERFRERGFRMSQEDGTRGPTTPGPVSRSFPRASSICARAGSSWICR